MKAYERLLNYVKYDTTSDENAPEDLCPSTENQKVFGAALAEEMKRIGFADAHMDADGYVYGSLPANCAGKQPVIGLISHRDTRSAASGANIRPRLVKYTGGDIVLNPEKNIVLRESEFPCLAKCRGMELIVTDGTTLLGGDDKAGIAEILTAAEALLARNIPHGKIAVAFTPDEEIGRGADRFDVAGFGADFAYTVDGGVLEEFSYENFNAASALVTVHGVSTHPGDAKDKMKNAALLGMQFHSLLPPDEAPEHTEGREGFYFLEHIEGGTEKAVLRYIIRDHDKEKFEARKSYLRQAAAYLNGKYGKGTFDLSLKDSYYNMRPVVEKNPEIVARAERAMRRAGVEPNVTPIRGGTDGAMLSFRGLPCPNLPTGGHNCHSRFEFVSVPEMDRVVEILVNLVSA